MGAEGKAARPGSRWRRWGVDALVVVGIVAAVSLWQSRGVVQGPAPELISSTPAGRSLSLADFRAAHPEKPVLLHFWATWCPICKIEEPAIRGIAEDHAVISVAMQSGAAAEVAAYASEHDLRFPILLDPDGAISRRFGVSGVPATLVIDPKGVVRFREVGLTSGWGLRLRLWWAGRLPAG